MTEIARYLNLVVFQYSGVRVPITKLRAINTIIKTQNPNDTVVTNTGFTKKKERKKATYYSLHPGNSGTGNPL